VDQNLIPLREQQPTEQCRHRQDNQHLPNRPLPLPAQRHLPFPTLRQPVSSPFLGSRIYSRIIRSLSKRVSDSTPSWVTNTSSSMRTPPRPGT